MNEWKMSLGNGKKYIEKQLKDISIPINKYTNGYENMKMTDGMHYRNISL